MFLPTPLTVPKKRLLDVWLYFHRMSGYRNYPKYRGNQSHRPRRRARRFWHSDEPARLLMALVFLGFIAYLNYPRLVRLVENKPVYYADCSHARAVGAPTPIYRWEPGYRSEMDGDDDGAACEPWR